MIQSYIIYFNTLCYHVKNQMLSIISITTSCILVLRKLTLNNITQVSAIVRCPLLNVSTIKGFYSAIIIFNTLYLIFDTILIFKIIILQLQL